MRYMILLMMLMTVTILMPICIDKTILDYNVAVADGTTTVAMAINEIVDIEHVAVIEAMVAIESGGDSNAVSPTGDYGILQVNKRTWSTKYDFNRMHELRYGLRAGYEIYLLCYEKAKGDLRLALRYYNGSWSYADKVLRRIGKDGL